MTREDEKLIDESLSETPEEHVRLQQKAFPRYQYSVFLDEKRTEQVVIRANTYREFIESKYEVEKLINQQAESPREEKGKPHGDSIKRELRCMFPGCNEPAEQRHGQKKDGSVWNGVFCSTGNRDHTKFL